MGSNWWMRVRTPEVDSTQTLFHKRRKGTPNTSAGSLGLESLNFSSFGNASSGYYQIGPGVTWRIFDAGRIRFQVQAESARTAAASTPPPSRRAVPPIQMEKKRRTSSAPRGRERKLARLKS